MKKKKKKLLLGAHMSIAGGFDKAIERGESISCTAMQIFTRSNRQWGAKKLTEKDVELFRKALRGSSIRSVIAHLPYLINIGSPNAKTRHASLSVLEQELNRCNMLGIKYLVLHPGSHLGEGEEKCLDRIAKGINSLFAQDDGKAVILLENMAGQGTNVGYQFEQLGYLIKNIQNKKRVGICFDTCHAFAAGYDFRKEDDYQEMWKLFGRKVGISKVKAFHLNDSKRELGSRVDRHENIGKGKLGREAFRLLMNDKRFFGVPKILETPKPTLDLYKKNMQVLKRLISPATKRFWKLRRWCNG
ncbi:deoxyribonuclease IV [Candidatus Dependentiae bacterium]